jgi:hypothetical protein
MRENIPSSNVSAAAPLADLVHDVAIERVELFSHVDESIWAARFGRAVVGHVL